MAKKKKSIDESCRVILCKMTKDELLYAACNKDNFAPEFYTMVMEVLGEKYGITRQYVSSVSEINNYFEGIKGTRNMFLDVLEEMGCKESIDFENDDYEDDGTCCISFSWQHNYFSADVVNDNPYIFIWESCGCLYIKDKEEMERVNEAINCVNQHHPYTVLYSSADDDSPEFIEVVCRSVFLFVPFIPNIDLYLIGHLKAVSKGEQLFKMALEDLRANRIPQF